MDRGIAELVALYDLAQSSIDTLMNQLRYRSPGFISRVFDAAGYNEKALAARDYEPLQFLPQP